MAYDYYQILGVTPAADREVVSKAYRVLARKHHPDRGGDAGDFQQIEEAYRVLSNPHSRMTYDRVLFGANGSPHNVGQDIYQVLPLRFEQAARGGRHTVTRIQAGGGHRRIDVTVPPAVEDGARLRIAGQGMNPSGGGPPGDLILVIAVEPHPRLRREGLDLVVDAVVPVDVAMRGGGISVTALDREVAIDVPPGSTTGDRIKVRAAGLRNARGQFGDLYAQLQVRVPRGPAIAPPTASDARPAPEELGGELGGRLGERARQLGEERERLEKERAELGRRHEETEQRSRTVQAEGQELDRRRAEVVRIEALAAEREQKLDRRERELAERQDQVEKRSKAVEEAAARVDRQRRELEAAREAHAKADAETRALHKEIGEKDAALRRERGGFDAAVKAMEGQREQLRKDLASLGEGQRRLAADRDQLGQQQRRVRDDEAALIQGRKQLVEDQVRLDKARAEAETTIQKAARDAARVAADREALNQSAEKVRQDEARARQERARLDRERGELEESRAAMGEIKSRTEYVTAIHAVRQVRLERAREALEKRVARVLAEAKRAAENIAASATAGHAQLKEEAGKLERGRKQLEQAGGELEKRSAAVESREKRAAEAEEQAERRRREADAACRAAAEREAKAAEALKLVEQQRRTLMAETAAFEESRQRVAAAEAELERERGKLAEALAAHRSEEERLGAERRRSREELAEAQRRLETERAELQRLGSEARERAERISREEQRLAGERAELARGAEEQVRAREGLEAARAAVEADRADLERRRVELELLGARTELTRKIHEMRVGRLDRARAALKSRAERILANARQAAEMATAAATSGKSQVKEETLRLSRERQQVDQLRRQFETQAAMLVEREKELEALEARLLESAQRRQVELETGVHKERKRLEDRAGELEKSRRELESRAAALAEQRGALDQQRVRIEAEAAQSALAEKRRREKLEALRVEVEAGQRSLAEQKQKYEAAASALEAAGRQLATERSQFELQQKRLADAEAAGRADRKKLEDGLGELERQRAELRKGYATRAFAVSEAADMERVRRDLEALRRQLDERAAALDRRQAELDARDKALEKHEAARGARPEKPGGAEGALTDVALLLVDRKHVHRIYPLNRSQTVIGRDDPSRLRVNDATISRKHCRIDLRAEGVWVEDLGSRNGTYRNSERVDTAELKAGDILTVGGAHFAVIVNGLPREILPPVTEYEDAGEEVEYDGPILAPTAKAGMPRPQPRPAAAPQAAEAGADDTLMGELTASVGPATADAGGRLRRKVVLTRPTAVVSPRFVLTPGDKRAVLDLAPHHARCASGYQDRTGTFHLFVDVVDQSVKTGNTWSAEVRYYRRGLKEAEWQWVATVAGRGAWKADEPAGSDADCFGAASPHVVCADGQALLFYAGRGGVAPNQPFNVAARPGDAGYLRGAIMLATAPIDGDGKIVGEFVKRGVVIGPGEGWDSMRLDHPCAVIDGEHVHVYYTAYDSGTDLSRRVVGCATAGRGEFAFTKHHGSVLAVEGGGQVPRVFRHKGMWHMFYQHFKHDDGTRWRHYIATDPHYWRVRDAKLFDPPHGQAGELMVWTDVNGRFKDLGALLSDVEGGVYKLFPYNIALKL